MRVYRTCWTSSTTNARSISEGGLMLIHTHTIHVCSMVRSNADIQNGMFCFCWFRSFVRSVGRSVVCSFVRLFVRSPPTIVLRQLRRGAWAVQPGIAMPRAECARRARSPGDQRAGPWSALAQISWPNSGSPPPTLATTPRTFVNVHICWHCPVLHELLCAMRDR